MLWNSNLFSLFPAATLISKTTYLRKIDVLAYLTANEHVKGKPNVFPVFATVLPL